MATRLKSLGLIFVGVAGLQCATANTVMLGANLNDSPALTITYEGVDPGSLSGFYIIGGYMTADCSSSVLATVTPMFSNFAVPTIAVSTNDTTSIGQQALYNTIATTYQEYSNDPPSGIPITMFYIKIGIINTIDYTQYPAEFTESSLAASGSVVAQCYQVSCNSSTKTCTTTPDTGYYGHTP